MSMSPKSLLNHADLDLNLWDMFIEFYGVNSNVIGSMGVLEVVKFAIWKHCSNFESTGRLY